jgi:hypothetical protein
MKVFITLFSIMLALSLHAQITLTQSDFPAPTIDYVVSHSGSIDSSLYMANGANQTWDFSGLTAVSQDTILFESPTSSNIPLTYLVFSNPLDPTHQATVAAGMEVDNGLPMITLENVYNFYKLTSSEWIQVGMGAKINGLPIPVLWNPTDVILNFPANYGDQDTSYSAYNVNVPSVGYYGENRMRVNNIDGYGTLITPYGTFDALKVTSTLFLHDSIYMDSMGFGFPTDRIEVEYKWFAHGYQMPVMQVQKRSGMGAGVTITYLDSLRNISVEEMNMNMISAFPNPVENNLFFEIPASSYPLQVEIFDLDGRLCLQAKMEKSGIDISGLESGFYSVRLSNDQEVFVSKFLKK